MKSSYNDLVRDDEYINRVAALFRKLPKKEKKLYKSFVHFLSVKAVKDKNDNQKKMA